MARQASGSRYDRDPEGVLGLGVGSRLRRLAADVAADHSQLPHCYDGQVVTLLLKAPVTTNTAAGADSLQLNRGKLPLRWVSRDDTSRV